METTGTTSVTSAIIWAVGFVEAVPMVRGGQGSGFRTRISAFAPVQYQQYPQISMLKCDTCTYGNFNQNENNSMKQQERLVAECPGPKEDKFCNL